MVVEPQAAPIPVKRLQLPHKPPPTLWGRIEVGGLTPILAFPPRGGRDMVSQFTPSVNSVQALSEAEGNHERLAIRHAQGERA